MIYKCVYVSVCALQGRLILSEPCRWLRPFPLSTVMGDHAGRVAMADHAGRVDMPMSSARCRHAGKRGPWQALRAAMVPATPSVRPLPHVELPMSSSVGHEDATPPGPSFRIGLVVPSAVLGCLYLVRYLPEPCLGTALGGTCHTASGCSRMSCRLACALRHLCGHDWSTTLT